jgi:hypothetical protein
MVGLSPHFMRSEFELDGPMPDEVVDSYTRLCTDILEPVRAQFGPIVITSGYRPPAANAAAHGQPNSEHMATADFCAADFKIISFKGDMRQVFDGMRNDPTLPFHQLILEKELNGNTIIHVSWNRTIPGVRSCLTGSVNNLTPYVKVTYVAYQPPAENGEQSV